jgi:hypothetical protein
MAGEFLRIEAHGFADHGPWEFHPYASRGKSSKFPIAGILKVPAMRNTFHGATAFENT